MQLEAMQRAMIAAIDRGPDFIPEGVFVGGKAGAMRGLRVHANTISHARLVALEETFPRTRALLGEGTFNRLSRTYAKTAEAVAKPLAAIGMPFAGFLAEQGAVGDAAALAAFEWLWLESYHAAEAEPLAMAALAGLDEERVLALVLARHPAVRLASPEAAAALADDVPDLGTPARILLTRPDADVLVAPATAAMAMLLEKLDEPCSVADLLSASVDENANASGEEALLPALIAIIEAGATVRAAVGED